MLQKEAVVKDKENRSDVQGKTIENILIKIEMK